MAGFGSFRDMILPSSFVFSASFASPFLVLLFAVAFLAPSYTPCRAQEIADETCPRPSQGSAVPEPQDLRSQNGVLKVDFTVHNFRDQSGSTRYCYVAADGSQSPTLRLNPGDLLILTLKNDLTEPQHAAASGTQTQTHSHAKSANASDPCLSGAMTSTSTNLHFHGLTVPPLCHQDDVLKTSIQPGDAPFEYRFRFLPMNRPACIGITRIFMASAKHRFSAEHQALSSSRASSAPIANSQVCPSESWSYAIKIC